MLRSVLATALSARDSCGPLLKAECILENPKHLEAALRQLKQHTAASLEGNALDDDDVSWRK